MRFVPVEKIPEIYQNKPGELVPYKPIRKYLEEFMKMDIKHARVDLRPYEYKSVSSAYISIRGAVSSHVFPIDVTRRNDEIYLTRRDI